MSVRRADHTERESSHWCIDDAESLINEFNQGAEGWPRMDGSAGIKIITADDFELDNSDFSVEEIRED